MLPVLSTTTETEGCADNVDAHKADITIRQADALCTSMFIVGIMDSADKDYYD